MLTAILAAKNILGEKNDLWQVNVDSEYHEASVSKPSKDRSAENLLKQTFAAIDKLALATAVGTVNGLLVFIGTLVIVLRGGAVIGPNLALLGQYFVGFTVSPAGACIGFVYAFAWGFLFGWGLAYLRNCLVGYYVYRIKKRYMDIAFSQFIDNIL